MKIDKSLMAGSTGMLILQLLEEKEMYGYEMIDTLEKRSDSTFSLKAGTLYPLLHSLEKAGYVSSREAESENGRMRKYYAITDEGAGFLAEKRNEWNVFSGAVNKVLEGGSCV
ncbi:MAG: PadR family transcriptional regulator [Oscillospiraceae bacterium]|nr:PadR family transcriptional regulator [Oscillospiraceae bacterium]